MRVRAIRWMSVAAVSTILNATMMTGAVGAPNATGDAHAIVLYAKAVKATNAQPVLRDTSANTYYLADNITTLSSYSTFAWSIKGVLPKAPSGFVSATSVTTYHLTGGLVAWTTTLIVPRCGHSSTCKNSVGLEFYDTAHQEKVALMIGSPAKYCWAQTMSLSQATFVFTPHAGVWRTLGKYSPIRRLGGHTIFTSTYTSGGYPIVETDYLRDATGHFDKSVYRYASTAHSQADTFSINETDPSAAPAAPKFPNCKS